MGVGRATDENLAFPEHLDAAVTQVRSSQGFPDLFNDHRGPSTCQSAGENGETQNYCKTETDSDEFNSDTTISVHVHDKMATNFTHGNELLSRERQCHSSCGRISRIMGDEQTSRTSGRLLRSMGDEIFCRYAIRRSFGHLVKAVANEQDSSKPQRPSSS